MPKNRQHYRKTKYPDKVTKPKRLVFVRIFLFCFAGSKIQYFPTAPFLIYLLNVVNAVIILNFAAIGIKMSMQEFMSFLSVKFTEIFIIKLQNFRILMRLTYMLFIVNIIN